MMVVVWMKRIWAVLFWTATSSDCALSSPYLNDLWVSRARAFILRHAARTQPSRLRIAGPCQVVVVAVVYVYLSYRDAQIFSHSLLAAHPHRLYPLLLCHKNSPRSKHAGQPKRDSRPPSHLLFFPSVSRHSIQTPPGGTIP